MPRFRAYPTREYLTECFEFSEVSDEHSTRNIHLFWRERPLSHFLDEHRMNQINSKMAGNRAGALDVNADGRQIRRIGMNGQSYLEHRCIYIALVDESIWGPSDIEIDHRDVDSLNNGVYNLRVSTGKQNRCNVARRSSNTSGYIGVYWHSQSRKWRAEIQIEGKRKVLCSSHDPIHAALVRDEAARLQHGEFAVLNFPNGVNFPLSV